MPMTMKGLLHRWRLDPGVGLSLLACGQATAAGGSGQDASGGPETAGDSGAGASGAQAGASSGAGGMDANNGTGGPAGGNGGGSTPGGSGGTATSEGVRHNFQGNFPEDATAETQSLATFFSVSVSTEARLLRVAHPLSISAPTSVTFDVFESATEEGPYQRLVSSEVTFETPGTLFHSDPMDLQLQGGYFYAFVISWESSMPVVYRIMTPGDSSSLPIVASATLGSPPGDSLALPEPADETYYTHYFIEDQ
jgi:hypothetical protein